ncbi:Protein of unknown function [Gryllus bimaculatus]
MFILV